MLSGSDLSRLAEFEALKCKQVYIVNTLEVLAAQIKKDIETGNDSEPDSLDAENRVKEFDRIKTALENLTEEFRSL